MIIRNRYEYRVAQVNDNPIHKSERYGPGTGQPPLYFHYNSLKAARERKKQVTNIPHVKIIRIERREVGPWCTIEKPDAND